MPFTRSPIRHSLNKAIDDIRAFLLLILLSTLLASISAHAEIVYVAEPGSAGKLGELDISGVKLGMSGEEFHQVGIANGWQRTDGAIQSIEERDGLPREPTTMENQTPAKIDTTHITVTYSGFPQADKLRKIETVMARISVVREVPPNSKADRMWGGKQRRDAGRSRSSGGDDNSKNVILQYLENIHGLPDACVRPGKSNLNEQYSICTWTRSSGGEKHTLRLTLGSRARLSLTKADGLKVPETSDSSREDQEVDAARPEQEIQTQPSTTGTQDRSHRTSELPEQGAQEEPSVTSNESESPQFTACSDWRSGAPGLIHQINCEGTLASNSPTLPMVASLEEKKALVRDFFKNYANEFHCALIDDVVRAEMDWKVSDVFIIQNGELQVDRPSICQPAN